MLEKRQLALAAGLSLGAVFAYAGAKVIWQKLYDYRFPYVPIGTVAQLYVYPLKSGRGKSVDLLECTKLGATAGEMRDRHFVVIDAETKKFLTGREASRLVLVECNLENDILTLGVINESGNSISINVDQVAQNGITERAIWRNETCDGFDCGNEVAQWLQSVLKIPNQVRLLYYVNGMVDNGRILKTEDIWMNSVTVYANIAPYLAVSLASLTKLQAKLPPDEAEKVSMRNFRPNIVVDGCPEFDEDRWMQVKIGQAEFTVLKPCDRFRLAPEGKMRKNLKDSPIFGTFMGMDRPGAIRMGDVVYARYKKEPF